MGIKDKVVSGPKHHTIKIIGLWR